RADDRARGAGGDAGLRAQRVGNVDRAGGAVLAARRRDPGRAWQVAHTGPHRRHLADRLAGLQDHRRQVGAARTSDGPGRLYEWLFSAQELRAQLFAGIDLSKWPAAEEHERPGVRT